MVIECKQSDLPYVFFLSESNTRLSDFPVISGLKTGEIIITSDDDPSSWAFRPLELLDLDHLPFLQDSVPLCLTLSKCIRKGKDLVLSGSDPYQNLIFPILKASSHFDRIQKPPPTAHYFDCEMVIGLAVLDAPMVGVRLTNSGTKIELLPWVRVVRHQPADGANKYDRRNVIGIDLVHKEFLNNYIDGHVLPFANEFSSMVLKHPDVLADERGFVAGMGKSSWTNIEPRLQRATLASGKKRWNAGFKNILSSLRAKH